MKSKESEIEELKKQISAYETLQKISMDELANAKETINGLQATINLSTNERMQSFEALEAFRIVQEVSRHELIDADRIIKSIKELDQDIVDFSDIKLLMTKVLRTAMNALRAEFAIIFVKKDSGLAPIYYENITRERIKTLGYIQSLLDECINNKKNEVRTEYTARFENVEKKVSCIYSHFKQENKIIGAIYLEKPIEIGFFHESDLNTLEVFSLQIAISVHQSNTNSKIFSMLKELNELNLNLEKKVEERTSELKNSLTKIEKLKSQQDADYALTAIILDPLLGINNIENENISLEFFTKQKKSFQFKNRKVEIGGDLIVGDTISLNNEKYSIFLCADAMGKSLQGACGALVLGVIFKAIVTNTNLNSSQKIESPEAWLISTVSEINRIFESFDGSMQASLILGIILERSNTLFYVNAEYPPIILYRNESTSTFEEKDRTIKIGSMLEQELKVHVKQFQLLPKDILFIGSDGKDDIILSGKNTKNRNINSDADLFLKIVKMKTGNLLQIVNEIEKQGSLLDDLSILRIAYKCN